MDYSLSVEFGIATLTRFSDQYFIDIRFGLISSIFFCERSSSTYSIQTASHPTSSGDGGWGGGIYKRPCQVGFGFANVPERPGPN